MLDRLLNTPFYSNSKKAQTFLLHTNSQTFLQSAISTLISTVFTNFAVFCKATNILLVLSNTSSKEPFTSITAYCSIMLSRGFVFTDLTISRLLNGTDNYHKIKTTTIEVSENSVKIKGVLRYLFNTYDGVFFEDS